MVDHDVSNLVLDDQNLLAVLIPEDVLDERRFAGPEESSDDGHGDEGRRAILGALDTAQAAEEARDPLRAGVIASSIESFKRDTRLLNNKVKSLSSLMLQEARKRRGSPCRL